MEQSNNSAFEFWTSTSVDGSWAESTPDDILADISGNEQRNTRSKTVSFLQQFVEQDHNETGNNKLKNKQQADTSTEVTRLTIQSRQYIDSGLSERQDDGKHYQNVSWLSTSFR